jgi:hypothetical protein
MKRDINGEKKKKRESELRLEGIRERKMREKDGM